MDSSRGSILFFLGGGGGEGRVTQTTGMSK